MLCAFLRLCRIDRRACDDIQPVLQKRAHCNRRHDPARRRPRLASRQCQQCLVFRYQKIRAAIAREFSHDLEFASFLARRVFLGQFFFKTVPQRMVEFTRRSARFRALMQDLFAGTQPYLELRKRLLDNLNGPIQETFLRMFLERVIPKTPA